jgi:peptidoglycan hydrolase-like protein with peptidoglycan-binding domain
MMHKIRNYAASLALVGLAACSSTGGGPQYTTRIVAPAPAPVASNTIRQVQVTLQQDGYYRQGPIDGVWGPGTENGVQAFQRDHSLAPSGQLDMPTLQALNLVGAPPPPPQASSAPAQNPLPDNASADNGAATNQMPNTASPPSSQANAAPQR